MSNKWIVEAAEGDLGDLGLDEPTLALDEPAAPPAMDSLDNLADERAAEPLPAPDPAGADAEQVEPMSIKDIARQLESASKALTSAGVDVSKAYADFSRLKAMPSKSDFDRGIVDKAKTYASDLESDDMGLGDKLKGMADQVAEWRQSLVDSQASDGIMAGKSSWLK